MEPQKGEIWLINFDPTKGSEIGKSRPAIVVSSNSIGKLPLRIVVPITSWQQKFDSSPWLIKLMKNTTNNLSNDSSADTFQVKSVSKNRFIKKIGSISNQKMKEIIYGIKICIEA
jgi:mRNA interferase MazF